jgi:hypothetical protein
MDAREFGFRALEWDRAETFWFSTRVGRISCFSRRAQAVCQFSRKAGYDGGNVFRLKQSPRRPRHRARARVLAARRGGRL